MSLIQLGYYSDGAHNRQSWRDLDKGDTGDFLKPLVARRLGVCRHRVWEVRDTSDTAADILGASIQAEPAGQ